MAFLWLLIFVVTILLNFIITDFMFLGISVGALIAIVLDFLGMPIVFQIIVFGIVAVFVTVVFYPKIKKKLNEGKGKIKNLEEKFIGIEFTLSKDVNGEVLINFKGSYWTFKNKKEPLKAGDKVVIVEMKGNKLLIEKVNPFRLESLYNE